MKGYPLEDRVLVRLEKAMERTKGGVYLPDSANRDKLESMKGEVLSAGPGRLIENGQRAPMQVKAGDIVFLSKYSGSDIIIEGETLRAVNETEILYCVPCKVGEVVQGKGHITACIEGWKA